MTAGIPSPQSTILIPAVIGLMAICCLHSNLAHAPQFLPDRVPALLFCVAAPYFAAVVLPAEQALVECKSIKEVCFGESLERIRTGHWVLIGLVLVVLALWELRTAERAKLA